ncbi:MAG: FAD-binding domain-containing protein [Pseudomonadota bacterium]
MPLKPTRDAALAMLAAFAPKMGRHYASGRNYDRGPGRHKDVSTLSPYVRRRLITEGELVATACANHGLPGAEKFVQEVFWRSYFKGWLERRPQIWTAYRDGLRRDREGLARDPGLLAALARAEGGNTGLACFDAWVAELVDTGYLHNHARMWFASIWIFTLGLPWRLGADFFYRHLLDGDPAANTLGWRWVAGLHTRGKAYQAKAWNVAKYTAGRFSPREDDFASPVAPLDRSEPEGLPPVQPIGAVAPLKLDVPTALLITEEDCHIESLLPEPMRSGTGKPVAYATLGASDLRSDRSTAAHVARFEAGALADAAKRLGGHATAFRAEHRDRTAEAMIAWARVHGAAQIATAHIPQGPLRDWVERVAPELQAAGVALCTLRRPWDDAVWRHATAGFFKVKRQIPKILQTLDIV